LQNYNTTHKVPEEVGYPEKPAEVPPWPVLGRTYTPLLPADATGRHRESPLKGWARTWLLVTDLQGRFLSLDVLTATGELDFSLTGNVRVKGMPVEKRDFERAPLTARDRIAADF